MSKELTIKDLIRTKRFWIRNLIMIPFYLAGSFCLWGISAVFAGFMVSGVGDNRIPNLVLAGGIVISIIAFIVLVLDYNVRLLKKERNRLEKAD